MNPAIPKTQALTLLATSLFQLSNLSTARADDDDGGSMAGGGGNTVGNELYDDYENKGTVQIPVEVIEKYAAPVLNDLDNKIPRFANDLREGISALTWYLEPKVLKQNGMCRNGAHTGLADPIDQVVRACQTDISVRIEKKWYEEKSKEKPNLVADLIVHELLVRRRGTGGNVSEDGLFRMSRAIRSRKLSAEKLLEELETTKFNTYGYRTLAIEEMESLDNKFWKARGNVQLYNFALCKATRGSSWSLFGNEDAKASTDYALALRSFNADREAYDEAADTAKIYKKEAQKGKEELARLAEDFCAEVHGPFRTQCNGILGGVRYGDSTFGGVPVDCGHPVAE